MKAKYIACIHLSSNIRFSLAFIVLLNKFVCAYTVTAYIGGITPSHCDPNGSENLFSKCISNMHNKTGTEFTASVTNRTGKFLFDTLFNINSPLSDDDLVDDDDDDVKTCNCGEWMRSIC